MASYKIKEDLYVGNTGKTLKQMSDLLTEYEIGHYIYRTRYVYNGTGEEGRYELFRLQPTTNWSARTITFQLQTYNSCHYVMGMLSYYNDVTIQGRYIFQSSSSIQLYFKKNTDNTLSVYCGVYYRYSPLMLTVLANSNDYDEIFRNDCPKVASIPSDATAFSNF